MNKESVKFTIKTIAFLAVAYPVFVWYENLSQEATKNASLFDIFPLLGLIAFSIMWLHVVGGAFSDKLEEILNYRSFVVKSSVLVLILIILHPALAFLALATTGGKPGDIFFYGKPIFLWVAIVAFPILVGYDIAKKFKKTKLLSRHWQKIKFVSAIGFLLTFVHSIGVGRDLQSGPLRIVWIFYGASAIVAIIYTYFLKPGTRKLTNGQR